MSETVLRYIEVGALLATLVVAIPGAYFSLTARITVNENTIAAEKERVSSWYNSTNNKLERIEKKIDCLSDKRMCGQ